MKKIRPYIVCSDGKGNLYEDRTLYAAGRSGFDFVPLYLHQMIEVPEGSDMFELPGRAAVGFNAQGYPGISTQGIAAASFIAPAYTQLHLAAYHTFAGAPVLPLYAYSPLAWYKGRFYTSAIRIDADDRQDCRHFDQKAIIREGRKLLKKYPANRLVSHLVENCAFTYLCPAARNFVMHRWEAPIPTSPVCNADCIGCISFQPADKSPVSCTQHRISFIPTPQEMAEFAIHHLQTAPRPVVSFGQGCEGEPLMVAGHIAEAVKLIRKKTSAGIINLNTNASLPAQVEILCDAGIDSVRISANSVREKDYMAYYRPKKYCFDDVLQSARIIKKKKKWLSLNYFVLPGFTDSNDEVSHLLNFIEKYKPDMIQWRNFNIDAEWYFAQVSVSSLPPACGMMNLLKMIRKRFPRLCFGYFNPHSQTMHKYRTK